MSLLSNTLEQLWIDCLNNSISSLSLCAGLRVLVEGEIDHVALVQSTLD